MLCIDGLEVSLVKLWNLDAFLQKIWGVHDVTAAIEPGEVLYTPLLWGAFLTGKRLSSEEYSFPKLLATRTKIAYGPLFPLYYLRVRLLPRGNLHLRKLLQRLRLYNEDRVVERFANIERLPDSIIKDTLVSKAREDGYTVWIKEFPSFNENIIAKLRAKFSSIFDKGLDERIRALNGIYNYSLRMLNEAIAAMQKSDLVFYYTPLIDYANHALFRPKKAKLMLYLALYYKRVARLVKRVSDACKNVAILVVSDHGYDPLRHDHSNYGFWSSNTPLPSEPKTILDFFDIILSLLRSK